MSSQMVAAASKTHIHELFAEKRLAVQSLHLAQAAAAHPRLVC
jgi:hypothetical protein